MPPPPLTDLLADARWVRTLARSLAADANDADDLAQDACLQALRHPPGHGENPRGWFARVLGNLVRQRHRADQRRVRRDTAAGEQRAGAATATDDLVERAATHRSVVDAVLALDEPYRATILLRFFEDLPPRAIAARMGVPVATVHTRLQRGCERLRQQLDSKFGHRGAWCAAVLPLPRLAAHLPSLGVLVMNGKALALGAALVVGASALWLGSTWLDAVGTPANAELGAPSVATAPLAAEAPPVPPETGPARVDVTAPSPAPTAVAAATTRLRGRLVDGDGRSLPGVQLVLRTDAPASGTAAPGARSDAAGEFTFDVKAHTEGKVVVAEPGWQTVMSATVAQGRQAPHQLLVVAARAVALAGHVRSADGRALAGALVQVAWPGDLRARLSHISDAAADEDASARSGALGEFSLAAASVRGALLVTTADGHVPDRRALPELGAPALEVTLQPMAGKPGTLQGQVVDARGMPVAGARVALGDEVVSSDERGSFVVDDDGKGKTLVAAGAGHRRAVVERGSGFLPFVVLALGGPPLTIRGRVVDETGRSLEGMKVWVADATLLADRRGPESVEGIASGHGPRNEGVLRLRDAPTAGWPWVRTDASGTFTLGGLEDRAYRVRAMDERTQLMSDVDRVPAGASGAELVLRSDELFAKVAGRVESRRGEPVAGVRVFVQSDPQRLGGSTTHGRAEGSATTDAEGRFELEGVPKRRVYLRLEGESILPLEYARGVAGGLLELSAGDATNLRVQVSVRLHVQVELAEPASADELVVLDAAGERIVINVFSGRGRRETDSLRLSDGKSPVFVVPDTAATLILQQQEKEVARHQLVLRAGDVNTLRL